MINILSRFFKSPYGSALASAIVMGSGQLINGQIIKGVLYIVSFIFCILYPIPYAYYCIEGLISLGSTPMQDHSLFMLVFGIIGIIILTYVLFFYISNIRDAYKNAAKLRKGETLPGFKASVKQFMSARSPLLFIGPGFIAITLVVILPLIFSIMIGFTNYDTYHQPPAKLIDWVGLKNLFNIFTLSSWRTTFFGILRWTVVWTILSSVLPYTLGITTAVVLNNPRIKFRTVMKTVYVLPFAIPGYIMILVWKGMFDTDFGLVNRMLAGIGIPAVPWFQDVFFSKMALVIVAVWAGFTFPFMLA